MRADAPEFIPSQHWLSATALTTTSTTTKSTTSNSTTISKTTIDNPIILEREAVISSRSRTHTKESCSLTRRTRKKRNNQKNTPCIVAINDGTYLKPQQERQRNNYQKHKTHQSSPPNTFIKPKRKDSIKFTDNNNSQKYDKSNVLKSVTTTNKNNTNEVVRGNEKQRRRKQEKNVVGIPQMVSNQRRECVQDTNELFTNDLFPPLHVSSESKITLGASTNTNDLMGYNRITRQQQISNWSTVIINAHLDVIKQNSNQQCPNIHEKKVGTSYDLTMLTKHQTAVEDDCLSSTLASHDEKEDDATTQDKPMKNRINNIDDSLLNSAQHLQSPYSSKNNNIHNKLIRTKRLKQRWVQIWNSKSLANIHPNFSSIQPVTSLEVSTSTEEVTFHDDEWEYVLKHTPKNVETEKYQTYPYASTDDDSSSTTTGTNNTYNCLADDLSFTCIGTSTIDGSTCLVEQIRSDSTLSELSKYISKPFPLHTAILNNNLLIFQDLLGHDRSVIQSDQLASWKDLSCIPPPLVTYDEEKRKIKMKPIHLSIILDKYHIVRALLHHESRSNKNWENLSINSLNNCNQTPLMVASYLGLEAYASLLLTNGAKINIKDNNGDTALHHCCRSSFLTGIELILNSARNRDASNNLHRMLCARNGKGETPYHTACTSGDNTVMEKLLSTSSIAITIKALQICDDNGRTPLLFAIENGAVDIVESLLLWRRNQQRFLRQKANYDAIEMSSSLCCPLLLAIQNENLDMLGVLLELWGGIKNSRFDRNTLDSALLHAAQSTGSFQHDAMRMLIEAGANPFEPSDSFEYNASLGFSVSKSVVSFLSSCGDISSLKVTLDSFQLASTERRAQRRQDHFLRNRPSFYFEAIEKKEDDNVMAGMQDALIESLFTSWRANGCNDVGGGKCLLTSAYLLKSGAVLNEVGYSRLLAGLSRMCGGKRFINTLNSCRTKYTHLILPVKKRGTSKKLFNKEVSSEFSMGYWSEVLSGMPWLWSYYEASTTKNFCGWWREKLRAGQATPYIELAADTKDACFLVVRGNRYLAHKSILSAKSKKLAAAFRFSSLQQQKKDSGCLDEVELDISLHLLSFLMQHCYHGSIFFGLSEEIDMCSQVLIELALVADEYICPTLLAECEMRLISLSGAKQFSCFCWCCCSSVRRNCMEGEGDFICKGKVQSTIECDYTVSLPPVTALSNNVGVAVTVLALCQQWAPCYCTGYEITVYGEDSSHCQFRYPMYQPFMVAKLLSLKTVLFYGFWPECNYNILSSFLDITKRVGDDLSGTTPINDDTKTVALLDYCLEEVSKYTLSTN